MENMDVETLAKLALELAQSKNGWALLALALVAAVWAARKYLTSKVPFLATQAGGATLTLVASFGGYLLTALMAGGPAAMTWALAAAALKVAVGAAGGWTLLKHLFTLAGPLLTKLLPKWFPPKADAGALEAKAAEAGKTAADATPTKSVEDLVNGGK